MRVPCGCCVCESRELNQCVQQQERKAILKICCSLTAAWGSVAVGRGTLKDTKKTPLFELASLEKRTFTVCDDGERGIPTIETGNPRS